MNTTEQNHERDRDRKAATPREVQLRSAEQKAGTPMSANKVWNHVQKLRKECARLRLENKRLTGALTLAEAERDQARYQLDHPGEPMHEFVDHIGQVVAATFPGEIIEDVDGNPTGMTITETVVAPVVGLIITEGEVTRYGLDPNTPGFTIVNTDGDIIRRNPTDQED